MSNNDSYKTRTYQVGSLPNIGKYSMHGTIHSPREPGQVGKVSHSHEEDNTGHNNPGLRREADQNIKLIERGTKSTRLAQSKHNLISRGEEEPRFPLQEALQTNAGRLTAWV